MKSKQLISFRFYLIIFLAFLTISIWSVYLKEPDKNVHIYFLDVGQGDAQLIQKGNFQLLIDGGPDERVIEKLSQIMPLEDREIEKVLLTHPHADHLVGLNSVMDRYKVKEVIYIKQDYESKAYDSFEDKIEDNRISNLTPQLGETVDLFPGARLKYLWPDSKATFDNINNGSVVTKFTYLNFSALFPGDCEIECWNGIIETEKDNELQSNVLKLAHHGSRNGTSAIVLSRVLPKFAIISLSRDNKYGFPHQEVVNLLESKGIEFYRTDLSGTIDVSTDGKSSAVKTIN